MPALLQELGRALKHQHSFPERQPVLRRLEARLSRRLQLVRRLQKMGIARPRIALLREMRPLLSLCPLDAAVFLAARQELARRNACQLQQLIRFVQQPAPVLAVVGCHQRWAQGAAAVTSFQSWRQAGWGHPLLITGNPSLPDWSFRFLPEHQWLQLSCLDSYESLPAKVLTLAWVLALLPEPPALLKLDDDARAEQAQPLQSLLCQLGNHQPAAAGYPSHTATQLCLDRGWHLGKSAEPANHQPFASLGSRSWLSGGAGYLLNGQAVALLAHFALHSWGFVESMVYEDVCVSMLLQTGEARMHWLQDPGLLGITSERHQEIQRGLWPINATSPNR